jgi:hypothetical protein
MGMKKLRSGSLSGILAWHIKRGVVTCRKCQKMQIEAFKECSFEHSVGCKVAREGLNPWRELALFAAAEL